jgi:histidinol phosphatase-like enzyme
MWKRLYGVLMQFYRRKSTIFINMDFAVRRPRLQTQYIIGPKSIELVPGRRPIMIALQAQGYQTIGLSHQKDVMHVSHYNTDDLILGFKQTNHLLGAGRFDSIYWSSEVSGHYVDCRIITNAIADHNLRRNKCLIVGQSSHDLELAGDLGFDFVWSDEFFNCLVPVLGS